MANRLEISDEEWNAIHPVLVARKHVRTASEAACRAFLVAVLWVLRSGAQWRLLPAGHGKWNSVFKRFSRGCRHGVWEALHTGCSHPPDLRNILIGSTAIRAHPCAAGAAEGSAQAEALGRSRGGFGTKIHAVTDGPGNPLDFVPTGGQVHDATQGEALLALTPEGAGAPIGDRGYDSDAFVRAIEARDMDATIPPRSNRTEPREVDWLVHKERHLIECFFNKVKHYRRIFSRYEKTARNHMGMLRFVSALIWLR